MNIEPITHFVKTTRGLTIHHLTSHLIALLKNSEGNVLSKRNAIFQCNWRPGAGLKKYSSVF